MTIETPRNVLIENVELNWAKLAKPVQTPFGTEQYELQMATEDAAEAARWKDELFLKVKEENGKFTTQLKRKARKQDGTDNGAPRVVDAAKQEIAGTNIGNGSRGNVIIFQYPYDQMGRKGVASSLTAVQVVELVEFTGSGSVDFADVSSGSSEPSEDPSKAAAMF